MGTTASGHLRGRLLGHLTACQLRCRQGVLQDRAGLINVGNCHALARRILLCRLRRRLRDLCLASRLLAFLLRQDEGGTTGAVNCHRRGRLLLVRAMNIVLLLLLWVRGRPNVENRRLLVSHVDRHTQLKVRHEVGPRTSCNVSRRIRGLFRAVGGRHMSRIYESFLRVG